MDSFKNSEDNESDTANSFNTTKSSFFNVLKRRKTEKMEMSEEFGELDVSRAKTHRLYILDEEIGG
jgi:hypothetical protein